jgi:hypothetical protein
MEGIMPDARLSRTDVEQLARKLDTLRGHFAAKEWALLSAVLGAAVETIRPPGPEEAGSAETAREAHQSAPHVSYDPGPDSEPDPDKIGN